MAKPPAVGQPIREKPMSRNSTMPTMKMVLYWRLRYAFAPAWMAAAISCMRALPAGRRRITVIEKTPYSTASTPEAIAAHSHALAFIRKSPRKKAAHYSTPPLPPRAWLAQRSKARSDLELLLELAPHRCALDTHVVRQAVTVGRIGLTCDQRLEVAPAGGSDAEAIRAEVLGRELLFLVGNVSERHVADRPAVGPVGAAHDGRHDRVYALQSQLHRRLADGVGLLDIHPRGNMPRRTLQVVRDR